MTNAEYYAWKGAMQQTKAALLRGNRDQVIVLGYPANSYKRYIEGTVIWSNTPEYPVGHASSTWVTEAFTLLPDADFTKVFSKIKLRRSS